MSKSSKDRRAKAKARKLSAKKRKDQVFDRKIAERNKEALRRLKESDYDNQRIREAIASGRMKAVYMVSEYRASVGVDGADERPLAYTEAVSPNRAIATFLDGSKDKMSDMFDPSTGKWTGEGDPPATNLMTYFQATYGGSYKVEKYVVRTYDSHRGVPGTSVVVLPKGEIILCTSRVEAVDYVKTYFAPYVGKDEKVQFDNGLIQNEYVAYITKIEGDGVTPIDPKQTVGIHVYE